MLIVTFYIIDISNKDLDTALIKRRPNPPSPLPYEGSGVSKPLSVSLRGLDTWSFSFSEMSNVGKKIQGISRQRAILCVESHISKPDAKYIKIK